MTKYDNGLPCQHKNIFEFCELKEAVFKRALIVIGESIFVPVGFTVSSNIGSVNYITPNASKATSADIGTLTAAKG